MKYAMSAYSDATRPAPKYNSLDRIHVDGRLYEWNDLTSSYWSVYGDARQLPASELAQEFDAGGLLDADGDVPDVMVLRDLEADNGLAALSEETGVPPLPLLPYVYTDGGHVFVGQNVHIYPLFQFGWYWVTTSLSNAMDAITLPMVLDDFGNLVDLP